MTRDSIVIYRNLYEALQDVSVNSYKRIMNAVLKYGLDGEELELKGTEKAVFQIARTQIDSNNKKYENGKKGASFGKLGGRPRKNHDESKETVAKVHSQVSYEEVMTDFGVEHIGLREELFKFISHLAANGVTVINDRLENIILALDRTCETDNEKIALLRQSVANGYMRLPCEEYYG